MKQVIFFRRAKQLLVLSVLMVMNAMAFAQEKVEVNGHDVGNWFKDHWMWIAGGVLLLLLIILAGTSSSSRTRKTTVIKDNYGNVKTVTSTETEDI